MSTSQPNKTGSIEETVEENPLWLHEGMVEIQRDTINGITSWLRNNVSIMQKDGADDVYDAITSQLFKERKEERRYRGNLEKKRSELIKGEKLPPLEKGVVNLRDWKEIASLHKWVIVVDPISNPKAPTDYDVGFTPVSPYEYEAVVEVASEGIDEATYRVVWHEDAPEPLKKIRAELVFNDQNYNYVHLYTHGGDHFLQTEYEGKDAQSYKGIYFTNCEGVYLPIESFYRDIYNYYTGDIT